MSNPIVNAVPLPEGNEVKYILTPFNNHVMSVALGRGYYVTGIVDVTAFINAGSMGQPTISCDHLMGVSRTENSNGDYTNVQYMACDNETLNGAKVWVDAGEIYFVSDGDTDRAESGIILQVTARFHRMVDDVNL